MKNDRPCSLVQEEFYGKPVLLADRETVETVGPTQHTTMTSARDRDSSRDLSCAPQGCDEFLAQALETDVAFLVVRAVPAHALHSHSGL